MSNKDSIVLKLGTIIRINATENDELHEKIFLINYLDENIIELINPEIDDSITLNIGKNGFFSDTTIENIEILSYPEQEGYALQNNLIPDKWISIRFGGDLPTTINGQITNLEDDMIEIVTYPTNKTIYINFDYKGIPKNLPILMFQEIKAPAGMTMMKTPVNVDEEDEEKEEEGEVFEEEEDVDLIETEKNAPDYELEDTLESELQLGDEIIFLEELGEIQETVDVSASEKRYSINEQKTDLLNSLLENIPTLERTDKLMDYFNKNVTRYDELRKMFSVFNSYGNIEGFKVNDKRIKPIIDNLVNFNKNYKWIIPVVKNKKKIVDINIDNDDLNVLNQVSERKFSYILTNYLRLLNEYKTNEVLEGHNKYYYFITKTLELFSPFEMTTNKENIIIEERVNENMDVLLDNLNNFESYTVNSTKEGKEEKYFINNFKFLMQRYVKGFTKIFLPDKYSKNYVVEPMTLNDKLSLKGLILLPYEYVSYSKINLHKTNILEKSNLNAIHYNYGNILEKSILIKNIKDNTTYEEDPNFLESINYYQCQTSIKLDDRNENYYREFLDKFIPSNKELFHKFKDSIKNKYNYHEIIKFLEPFGIYENNINYSLYRDIVLYIEENNFTYKKNLATNIQIYANYLSNISKVSVLSGLFKLLETTDVFEHYMKYSNFNSEIINNIFYLDNGLYLYSLISKENINLLNDVNIDEIIEETITTSKNKDEKCGDLVLAKRYISMEELEEDDSQMIYFDKKYDETRYEVMEEFLSERDMMSQKEFLEFLTQHLMDNVGMSQENAVREAGALILGKKEVIDGDFAILDIMEEDLKYYERKGGNWSLVDEFSGKDLQSVDFCNLKQNA